MPVVFSLGRGFRKRSRHRLWSIEDSENFCKPGDIRLHAAKHLYNCGLSWSSRFEGYVLGWLVQECKGTTVHDRKHPWWFLSSHSLPLLLFAGFPRCVSRSEAVMCWWPKRKTTSAHVQTNIAFNQHHRLEREHKIHTLSPVE